MNNSFYDPYRRSYYHASQQNYCPCNMTDSKENMVPDDNCGREEKSAIPKNTSVAMAYVPYQTDFEVYDCEKAFKSGTLFPCLDKPFTGCCRYE